MNRKVRLFDIAANLTSPHFRGIYYDKQYHDGDIDQVISRANRFGVDKLLIAATHLQDAIEGH